MMIELCSRSFPIILGRDLEVAKKFALVSTSKSRIVDTNCDALEGSHSSNPPTTMNAFGYAEINDLRALAASSSDG